MTMLERLSNWIAERQERQIMRKTDGAELTGDGVPLSKFMSAFNMPDDTRTRMSSMAENYGLPQNILETEHGRSLFMARACGECRTRGRCAHWLEGDEPGVAPEAFCPNADRWSDLVRQYPTKVENSSGVNTGSEVQ